MHRPYVVALGFFCFGMAILIYLCTILVAYPLFDWAITEIKWCQAWLYMTVLDYYGVACCLAAIAMHSESHLLGVLWSAGFMFLGSPVCCAYVCYRLVIHGGLCLETTERNKDIPFRHLTE